MYTTILTLYKQGISQRKIARTTNVHRKTVKNIINRYEKSKIETPVPYNRPSMTDLWHEEIVNLMSNKLSTVRIHEELKNKGYNLSYSSLSRYIRSHNIKNSPYAKTLFSRKFTSSFIDAIFAATSNLYLIAK